MKIFNEEEVRLIANAAAVAAAMKGHPGVESVEDAINKNVGLAGLEDFGIWEIARERADQLWRHNRTVDNDVEYNDSYQLSYVAGLLISWDYYREDKVMDEDQYIESFCPPNWNKEVFRHMLQKPYVERIRVAGALCAGEITRCRVAGDTGHPCADKNPQVDKFIDE